MLQHGALRRVEDCDFLDLVFFQFTIPSNERLQMKIADGAACKASELQVKHGLRRWWNRDLSSLDRLKYTRLYEVTGFYLSHKQSSIKAQRLKPGGPTTRAVSTANSTPPRCTGQGLARSP
jgi:hypothetical protein